MAERDLPAAGPKFGVGQSVVRREDDRLLRGAGTYVDDIVLERQLYAVFVRSPYAHARIAQIDAAPARDASGVAGVYTHADAIEFGLRAFGDRTGLRDAEGEPCAPVAAPHLANDVVWFVGQPVAMIVAESPAAARDAVELVEVDYQELPVVTDPRDEDAPQIHPAAPGNVAFRWTHGDAEAADLIFVEAPHVVRAAAPCQRLVVAPMEPRAVNALWDAASERWTVHCATQGAHEMRHQLSAQLGVEHDRIRVLTPDVGGGFGMKLMVHPEYALCAAAARALGRPVKWTADRSESFVSDAMGRAVEVDAEGAFDADGRLRALRLRQFSDLGAHYCQYSAGIHTVFSGALVGGLYQVEAVAIETFGKFTNKTPMDAYRGAGRPEAIYATELVMEAGARALGLDPAEIRRRNLRPAGAAPFETTAGLQADSAECQTVLDRALEASNYAGVAARKEAARARGRLWGVGVSYYVERTGGSPVENARLRVQADGRIQAWVGTQSTGQGHETAWSQIIHEKLGVDFERIEFPIGDSDALPKGGGTGGSRSLIVAHRVFAAAADQVVEQGMEAAALALEAAPSDIEFVPEIGGRFRVVGTDRQIDLFDAAAHAKTEERALVGEGLISDSVGTLPNGAHVAEVEIDPETGAVQLKSYVIVDDFGFILNPLLAAGQVHGGVVQGIGQALLEGAVYEPDSAQPLAGSFMDYAMPRAADIPPLRCAFFEDAPSTTNPLGVKGAGEAGSVGATPSVALAVLDALRPYGVERLDTPMTPHRVWLAIRNAER